MRGAAHWLLVAGLLLMASLAGAWSLRAAWLDLLGTQARGQGQQARWAAQAALASGQAAVQEAMQAAQPGPETPELWGAASTLPCPPERREWPAPRWQCAGLPLGAQASLGPASAAWSLQLLLARDVRDAPHIWQLLAQAQAAPAVQGSMGAQAQGRVGALAGDRLGAMAQVRAALQVPVLAPAPADPVGAALLLAGCWSAGAGSDWQICPRPDAGASACASGSPWPAVQSLQVPDTDGDGLISNTERRACLALGPAQLPAGGALIGPAQASAQAAGAPCARAVWRSLFGDTRAAQLQAWSDAQARSGLHAGSSPPRSVYWIDSPLDWGQSLGSPEAPVLLVFSAQACATRCPRLLAGVQIHGTVYLDAGCDDRKLQGWQGGRIDGLLAVEGGLLEAGGSTRLRGQQGARQAWQLHWPGAPGSAQVPDQSVAGLRRLPGSHRADAP